MSQDFTICEYGVLATRGESVAPTRVVIPLSAWRWLRTQALQRRAGEVELLRPIYRDGHEVLQIRNYVGVLETPCGTRLEILPKTINEPRQILLRMLRTVFDLSFVQWQKAALATVRQPLLDVLIPQFLQAVSQLLQQGIRSDYSRINEYSPYLKGQLQLSRQLRQAPTQHTWFHVECDQFLPNRPENRLLHLALKTVLHWTHNNETRRLARKLCLAFSNVPVSQNISKDLAVWCNQRDMAHYRPLKSWCELILSSQTPYAMCGSWSGLSLLFPMETLFEAYVTHRLNKQLHSGFQLHRQMRKIALVRHRNMSYFRLQPDMVIVQQKKPVTVLDAKWKSLNANLDNASGKYGLEQRDLYQLFAYGEKYLNGQGEIFLIFPANQRFMQPLPLFKYHDSLLLWVVPFDLQKDRFIWPDAAQIKAWTA